VTSGTGVHTPDLLAAIVEATRTRVAAARAAEPADALARRASGHTPRGDAFAAALKREGSLNVIAECKRRSPSRGVLRSAYDPVAIARGYARAGAAAISVLTEPTFFDGSLEHLAAVRAAVEAPILRKDFVVSEYQLFEARAAAADAVLLIVAALAPAELTSLLQRSQTLGLDALVEVHDADQLARAIDAGATTLGVNNRDLRTLHVDVGISEQLIGRVPSGALAVSESGLKTGADLRRLRGVGFHAFLVGERFMVEADPGHALSQLLRDAGEVGAPGTV
jgi:indole-3-glycerol phosphate synthase